MLQRGEISCYYTVVNRGGRAAPISIELLARVSPAASHVCLTCAHLQQVNPYHSLPLSRTPPCILLPPPLLMPDPSPLLPAWSLTLPLCSWIAAINELGSFGQETITCFFLFDRLFFSLARKLHSESNEPQSWYMPCYEAGLPAPLP